MGRFLVFLAATAILVGCTTEQTEEEVPLLTDINITFEDSLVRKILDLQDKLAADSLLPWLKHRDPTYRLLAADAFASIQDDAYTDTLVALLDDPITGVRQAAAYALGQLGAGSAEPHLLSAFDNVIDSIEDVNTALNASILEAIGKCGSRNNLVFLSEVSTYTAQDDQLLLGQARAIYRYMLRGLVVPSGTDKMVSLLAGPDIPQEVRMLAAGYLARADIDLSGYADVLSLTLTTIEDPEIKMFLPLAIIKTADNQTVDQLRSLLKSDEDVRVQCNAIRAMGQFNFARYRSNIQAQLDHRKLYIALTAAETILTHSDARFWKSYMTLSLGNYPWQVKTRLLHAVSKLIPSGNEMFSSINQDLLRQRLSGAGNSYERAAALAALAEYPGNYTLLLRELASTEDPVIRTACIRILSDLVASPRFRRISATGRQNIVDQLISTMQTGDVAAVEIIAQLLTKPEVDLTAYQVAPKTLLQEVKSLLQMPRDSEAYFAVVRALAELDGTEFDPEEHLVFTHAIEWPILQNHGDTIRASITTNRGIIETALYPKWAPGSVANFVDLVNLNYYAGKQIHRVVPGFVIQAGCNRGDGYGSMDYNIRSELGQHYFNRSGLLGMASAGNHTESAQWFITQGPAPHLDGRYTLFGEVIYGMEIVQQLEVGDVIQDIKIR